MFFLCQWLNVRDVVSLLFLAIPIGILMMSILSAINVGQWIPPRNKIYNLKNHENSLHIAASPRIVKSSISKTRISIIFIDF
jgi:hypothetical protein